MKIIFKLLVPLCLFEGIISCSTPQGTSLKGIEHVVIIGIDGFSTLGLKKAETPVMDRLIKEGSWVPKVRTVLPSSSSPNWASILMGAGPEQHGVTDNDWELNDHTLDPIAYDEYGRFPSIFSVIRAQKPVAETGSVYHWEGFGRLYDRRTVSFNRHFSTPDSTSSAFAAYLKEKKPLFAFMHLDHVDDAGHEFGHGSHEYFKAISKADSLIGTVLKAIKEGGFDQNTLVMIVADHGGIGYGHGGNTPEEMHVPMIFYGKDVKKGYVIQQQVYQYDIAATVAFALQIIAPYAWIGRPIKAAFEGFDEPKNLWLGVTHFDAPVIYPDRLLYKQPGGLYINKDAEVRMTAGKDQIIRYTIDGSEPTNSSTVYSKPFALQQTAVVTAKSFDKSGKESLPSKAFFRILKKDANTGLNTKLYVGEDWKQLPAFKNLTPFKQGHADELSMDKDQVTKLLPAHKNVFGLVYDGFLQVDQDGEYQFYTQSDDGSKLYIDQEEVVNNDGGHGVIEKTGIINLKAGKHPIRVEYFNGEGGYWLEAYYKGPNLSKQIIPANKLFLKP
ncbi:Predicted pyrophosphatase or phosphodiesterase, AlkP superfamily [bacterium A37T11]|nr:Predicted pyrophosphatase or phosphodiesterase, AlkP superfamily [bacterium A37T11]